jgi:enamine deaminase RidA (YjgF/YER057c/UK114 family)
MRTRTVNPADGVYPATSDYVHAMEVADARRLLFVSGTMGLDVGGRAPKSLDAQLVLIWGNIRRILAEAEMTTDNIVRLTSYLSDASFAEANARARVGALGHRRIPTTAIVAQLLSPEWLVEIEVVGAD